MIRNKLINPVMVQCIRDFKDSFLEDFRSGVVGEAAEGVTVDDVGVTVAIEDAAVTVGWLLPCCWMLYLEPSSPSSQ